MVPFTKSGDSIVFVVSGTSYKVVKGDKNYYAVAKAIKDNKNGDEILEIFRVGGNIQAVLKDMPRVTFDGTNVFVDGEVLHDSIVQKVVNIARDGLPVEPVLKFIDNVSKNPSFNSRQQGYGFLEHSDIALTEDGYFIAFRAVANNYLSKRANKDGSVNRNMVGDVVEMDRSLVDDNPDNHCSQGLHVGSIKYAGQGGFYHNYGDRTMLVKVNPADIVSVPNDHSCQKCRVCKYEVVGEVDKVMEVSLYTTEGQPYPVQFADAVEFSGFDYDDDYDDDNEIYDYEDEDEWDSEIDFEDDDDFEMPRELRL